MICEQCSNYSPKQGLNPGDRFTIRFGTEKRRCFCILCGENGKYRLIYLDNGGFAGDEIDIGDATHLPLQDDDIDKLIGNADSWVCTSRGYEHLFLKFRTREKRGIKDGCRENFGQG